MSMGQDRQNWHLNLTFQVTCVWQLSQFLRYFISIYLFLWTPSTNSISSISVAANNYNENRPLATNWTLKHSGCKGLNNQDNAYFTQWCCCGRLIFICTFWYLWSMTLVIWSFSWRNSVDWEALGLNNQDNALLKMIDAEIIKYSLCLTVK